MKKNKIYTIHDTTTFETKDYIETWAYFWPINKIEYNFIPAPDTIKTTTINKVRIYTPWARFNLDANIPLKDNPIYISSDLNFDVSQGFRIGPYAAYEINKGSQLEYGIKLRKEWEVKNPINLIFK